jgi:hypothetical protein
MLVLEDGGGIYTQGRTGESLRDGELVADNVIENQVSSGPMLYTDYGSAMITLRGNVAFGMNYEGWGSRHKDYYDGCLGHYGRGRTLQDNLKDAGFAPAVDPKTKQEQN